jgi:excisionase family DNA binding protein
MEVMIVKEVYYTPDEVAERLRVSAQTVRRWCNDGILPVVRVCRHIRIPASAVEALVSPKLYTKGETDE